MTTFLGLVPHSVALFPEHEPSKSGFQSDVLRHRLHWSHSKNRHTDNYAIRSEMRVKAVFNGGHW